MVKWANFVQLKTVKDVITTTELGPVKQAQDGPVKQAQDGPVKQAQDGPIKQAQDVAVNRKVFLVFCVGGK